MAAGTEWELSPLEGIEGAETPKIVEWEDLQEELARLWSLSAALKKAEERKESLAQKLESIIEARRESLRLTNELKEMRQKLEVQKVAIANLSIHTVKTSEDVKNRRAQLCFAIRMLLVSGKTLSAAHQQLQEANKLLSGKRVHWHLRNLQKMLRTRQQYMVSQVATLYPMKGLEQTCKEKQGSDNKSRDSTASCSLNVSKAPQLSPLTILGLQLTALPLKRMGFFSDKKEIQRSATVLGYVAHAVLLIASYLDVPLRYPLRLGGSCSYIHDYAPSIESLSSDLSANPIITGMSMKPPEFPLFLEGQDTTRAAYAIFLLNKDLEQLLNDVGAESLGPRHVLANLKELMRIIQSQQYIDI
ncbi:UV radiation resistance-associated gene protein isoform X1 [Phoenix dactylifera]|uniref:UV radiation resistance-associated gene protein isoform X1 n=1 Tax=Phoenix dactylifera TaxID=42345 RepID=A0A8B7BWD0_PHODC|nr:UV radiation resistance-associated gene protein isoform X1 [Phoenix dactylifera]